MRYQNKSFTVPATNPTTTVCKVHHFVNGQCLRCPEKIETKAEPDDS